MAFEAQCIGQAVQNGRDFGENGRDVWIDGIVAEGEEDGRVQTDDDAALFDANVEIAFIDFIVQLSAQQVGRRGKVFERRSRWDGNGRVHGRAVHLVVAPAGIGHGAT